MILLLLSLLSIFFSFTFSYHYTKKNYIYDIPNKRKIHTKPTLCIGGIYFFLALLFSILIYFYFKNFSDSATIYESGRFFLNVVITLLLILTLGIIDDKRGVKQLKKICFLFLINLFFFSFMSLEDRILNVNSYIGRVILLDQFSSVILPALCFTIFIIFLGLIDGINCLLATISNFLLILIIPFLSFSLISFINILLIVIILHLSFFTLVNYRSKVFLGNSGSMVIAFLVALIYYKNYKLLDGYNISNIEIMILSIWFIIFDVIRVFIKRIKNNKSPFNADRNHFHHILIKKYSLIESLIIYFFLNFSPIILFLFLTF